MSDTHNEKSAAPAGPPGPSLTRQTARGFIWMLGQTLGSKFAAVISQILLARLLLPRDFGLIALAYTAVAFAGVIRQTGIQQILVQRQKHSRRWVNPAFWFELTVGIATAFLLAIASPIAALVFHSSALIGLILVIATAAPLSPWFVIPTARLMIDMRFKAIAAVNITYNFIAMALSIFLAWRGFGAYSFVIPLPVAGAIRALWLWKLARPRINGNPQFRRWRFLLGDSGYMLATGFITSAMVQAGSLALGVMYSKTVVGQFFFALNLSMQIAQLLSQNLGGVLMPAFAKLQEDRPRQIAALVRASRVLAFVSIPSCVALAVVARPIVEVIYGVRWLPAVPVLQILSIAVAINIPSNPSLAALQAQGRFWLLFGWTALQAPVFFVAVFAGAFTGGGVGVSVAILLFTLVASPSTIRLCTVPEAAWREVYGIYAGPIFSIVIALVPVAASFLLWPPLANHYFIWLSEGALLLFLAYFVTGRFFCRAEFQQAYGYASSATHRVGSSIKPAESVDPPPT